jgi:hypothetical protein
MAVSSQESEFLEAATAAIPKIVHLIAAMPPGDRAEALEVAELRFLRSAEEFGCAEPESWNWTAAVMRILLERVEELVSKQKLKALYEELVL